ncbi:hypothetical protein SARC_15788, partial [Sphaeroforma arctica JP610]
LPKNGTASGTSTATATKKTKRPEIPAVAKYIPEKSKPVLLDKKGPTKKDPGAVSINSTHAPNRTSGAPSASTATATNPTTPQASRGNVVSTAPTTPAANRSRRKHVTRDEDALLEQRIYDTLSGSYVSGACPFLGAKDRTALRPTPSYTAPPTTARVPVGVRSVLVGERFSHSGSVLPACITYGLVTSVRGNKQQQHAHNTIITLHCPQPNKHNT